MRELQQDRRRDEGLVFDAARGRLSMGANGTDLPRGGGNRAVLEVYVDLVARCRGTRPDTLMEVRAEDISGLSAALDLDAADLRLLIEEILAVDTDQAVGLLIRLLQHRLVVGAAVAAAGVVAVGALALGGSSGSAGAEPVRPAAITTTTVAQASAPADDAPVIDGPLVETEDGVGLIPAVQEERDGTVLIPAEQLDAEPVAAAG